jgi:hypothetical protein
MPKKSMDYSNTVIYKLVCNDLNITDCYVGHTTNFKQRKNDHKRTCNIESRRGHNLNVYKFIRENGGFEKWSMIEIEKYPCADGNEARKRERFWYENLKATLNTGIPSRTQKEWFNDNQSYIKQYKQEYHNINADTIAVKKQIYQKEHKEEIKEYLKNYRIVKEEHLKEMRKAYYETNKDKLLQQLKQYREANKEIIREKKAQIYQANKDEINAKRREKARLIREAKKVEKDT